MRRPIIVKPDAQALRPAIALLFSLIVLQALLHAWPASAEEATWTILVYMSGDNDLEPFALKDLDEMERGLEASPGSVNVIVLLDKTARDYELEPLPPPVSSVLENTPGVLEWTGARVIKVEADQGPGLASTVLDDWGEVNMGDPSTLTRFIKWVAERYPSQRYMLVIWDHGSGPGLAALDVDNGGDILTLREIRKALLDAGVPLDIVGFDACLMASVDTAYALRGLAGLMVASEETEPGDGWDYEAIISWLARNPSAQPLELAQKVVDTYIEYYMREGVEGVTLSVVELKPYAQPQFEQLVAKFIEEADNHADSIRQARLTSLTFGGGDEATQGGNQVDALSLLGQLAATWDTAAELRELLENSVKYSRAWGGSVEGAGGLTLHFPLRADINAYMEISEMGEKLGWARFLEALVNVPVQVQPPQATGIPLIRLYQELGITSSLLGAAGSLDFDGDGREEFVVYSTGVEGETGDYMLVFSILKLQGNQLVEHYSDALEWGAPLDNGDSPFDLSGVFGDDIDQDGRGEIIDSFYYYDGFSLYTVVDRIELEDGEVVYNYVFLSDFLADWSDVGNLDGKGGWEIVLVGNDIDMEAQAISGGLYILSAEDLETLYSYDLDHPEGTYIEGDVTVGNLVPAAHGDEIALSYNIVDAYQDTVVGARLVIATLGDSGLEIIAGTEVPGAVYSVSAGDVDGDGVEELVVTYELDRMYLSILDLSRGDFQELGRFPLAIESPFTVAAEAYDIDGDGIVEILLGYAQGSQQYFDAGVEFYAFLPQNSALQPEYATSLSQGLVIPVAADVNGDKKPEIVYVMQRPEAVYVGVGLVENYVDPTGSLQGTIVDPKGNPIEGARVKLSLPRSFNAKTVTDENGKFNFTGVPEGTYQLDVLWRSPQGLVHAKAMVSIKAGETREITLTLTPPPPPPETETQEEGQQSPTPSPTSQATEPEHQASITETHTTQPTPTTTPASPQPAAEASPQQTASPTETKPPQESRPETTTATEDQGQQQTTATVTVSPVESGSPTTTPPPQGEEPEPSGATESPPSPGTATQTPGGGEGGAGVKTLVAVQAVIVVVLAISLILVRRKRSTAPLSILLPFLLALLASPIAMPASAQGQQENPEAPAPPAWLYPGMRAVYSIIGAESITSPWSSGGFYYINVMGLGGGEQVSITTEGRTESIRMFETYVVNQVERGRVTARLVKWGESKMEFLQSLERNVDVVVEPREGLFNGPFWVDPRLIAQAREGGAVVVPGENGARRYEVIASGVMDISPFSNSPDSLNGRGFLAPQIPLPEGTYRDVLVLRASVPTNKGSQDHVLIVDRETGLILVETLGTLEGGVSNTGSLKPLRNQLLVRSLAEIYLDLEDKLRPYEDYVQDPLVHAGYTFHFMATLVDLMSGGYVVSISSTIEGVYKDSLLVSQVTFLGPASGMPTSEIALFHVDKNTGKAVVVECSNPLAGGGCSTVEKGTVFDHTLIWLGSDAGRGTVNIMGSEFRRIGTQPSNALPGDMEEVVYEKIGANTEGIDIARLTYLENGLLVGLALVFQGQLVEPSPPGQPGSMVYQANNLQQVTRVPATQPQAPPPNPNEPNNEPPNQQEAKPAGQEGGGIKPEEDAEAGPQAPQASANNTSGGTVTVTVTVTASQETALEAPSGGGMEASKPGAEGNLTVKTQTGDSGNVGGSLWYEASVVLLAASILLGALLLRSMGRGGG